jgi:geranylgeranyl diphosphate synthase, type II
LIHDDIMDDAPIRRGLATVHEKWDINTGILSGDAMMILAYRQLEQYEDDRYFQLMKVFNQVALEVCEGQQLDVNFETQMSVSESEYMTMIRQKTAVLVAAALQMGAIVARASDSDQNSIYSFGVELGIAFQLQDDYLDAFGDPKTFGKQVGGDIIENKKTFLYLKAIELLDAEASKSLQKLFNEVQVSTEIKVEQVKSFFLQSKADEVLKLRIDEHTQNALNALESTSLTAASKEQFRQFAVWLMTRVS